MSSTTSNALKAKIEASSLGLAAYRDVAPEGLPLPYVTINEALSITSEDAFNRYDDPERHVVELVQVDLWQAWRDPLTRRIVEDPALADSLVLVLDAVTLPTAPFDVVAVEVTENRRILENRDITVRNALGIVHNALTLDVKRVLLRTA